MHNKHRLGHSLIAAGIFSWLALSVAVSVAPMTASAIASSDISALSNSARANNGLSALVTNSKLNQAAQNKAQDMLTDGYFAHTAPDGTTGWDFMAGAGYSYQTAGENLASSNQGASSVVNGWLNSPGHRANLLSSSFIEVGYGVVYVGDWEYQGSTYPDTYYVVALYAVPTSSSQPPPAEPEPAPPEPEPVAENKTSLNSQTQQPASDNIQEAIQAETVPDEIVEETENQDQAPPEAERVLPVASVVEADDSPIPASVAILAASFGLVAVISGVVLEIRHLQRHPETKLHWPHIDF